jgi:hypothetical protein
MRYAVLRILTATVVLAIFSAAMPFAHAMKVAIRAPIGCVGASPDCSEDISLAEAQKKANDVSASVKTCLEKKKRTLEEQQKLEKERLREQQEKIAKGLPVAPSIFAPFAQEESCLAPAATERNICSNRSKNYGWAMVHELSDGSEALTRLLKNAESGKPLNNHFQIVEASESRPGEQHLALCEVRVINGDPGPPHNCATVAIITPTKTLLRMGVAPWPLPMCVAAATFRTSGAIDINFQIRTDLDASAFSDSLARMLKDDLGFATEQVDRTEAGRIVGVSFRSTAALRDSPILQGGWREALDFDLSVSPEHGNIAVHGYTDPKVCRQASGQLIDYHGPDDKQKATYATVLNESVKRAITRVCRQVTKVDDRTIECR